jgi:very-short-patch-repair endonuclease
MEAICVPGRPGGRLIKKIVSERETEQGLSDSAFERLLLRTIKRAQLPVPVCQWPCVDRDFCAFIDLAYPELGIAIEADGYRWHDGRQAFEADRKRASELASRGWRVIQVTWLQLKYDPEALVTRLDRALRTPPLAQLRA